MRARAVLLTSSLWLIPACGPTTAPSDDAAIDTHPDAGCATNADCDDGLFCNGAETCVGGGCMAGTPVMCRDAIDCTIDSCSDDRRACVNVAPDADHDGARDASCRDAAGVSLGDDCADDDATRFPGNVELCDPAHHDEDCDATTTGASDADGDGFLDARCCDGNHCGDDCNDARATVHPGVTEVCNGIDDDCNGMVDEGVSIPAFVDADRDGYGDPAMATMACSARAGFATDGTDCDDADATRNPGQVEFCDTRDNDCDTRIDEMAAAVLWYRDVDGDGFGNPSNHVSACIPPAGRTLRGTDCDDASASINPGQPELCNALDDDCDGSADFVVAPGDLEDDDGDGVADAACGGADCDDLDAYSAPGQPETCNGRDDDCDGRIDEGASRGVYYLDTDGDGFGGAAMVVGCAQPAGYARRGGDCDDGARTRFPGATETCNAADDDCDGALDEAPASSSCTIANAQAVCIAGTCQVATCALGYADCAGTGMCTTDLRRAHDHCGACSVVCAADSACSGGHCGPTLVRASTLETASTATVTVRDAAPIPGTGDIVVVGSFTGRLSFGATANNSVGGSDGFAARIHADGTGQWIGQWGSAEDGDALTAVTVDPSTGMIYVAGRVCGSQYICGGPIGSAGVCHAFFQPVSCSYADVLGTNLDITSIALDRTTATPGVLLGGRVLGPEPSIGVAAATGDYDGFVARFQEPSGANATFQWVHRAASNYLDQLNDIAFDGAGHVVAVGAANGGVNLGAGPMAYAGYNDSYVMTLNSATGALVAGRFFGSGLDDFANSVVIVGTTAYVAGTFQATLAVGDSTPPAVTSSGVSDGYILSMDVATGGAHWLRRFGGTGDDGFFVLASVDSRFVAGGVFQGSVSIGGATFGAVAGYDAWAIAVENDGTFAWGRAGGGTGTDVTRGLAYRGDAQMAWLSTFDGPTFDVLGSSVTRNVGSDVALTVLAP